MSGGRRLMDFARRRALTSIAYVVALAGATLIAPPAGYAEPPAIPTPPGPRTGAEVGGGPTFSLTEMGVRTPLTFYGDQGTAELTFPVPRGLVPRTLNATVELPVNVRSGAITVMQQERTVARIPLPADDQAAIVIPLDRAAIVDNAVTVTLRTYLVPDPGYCLDPTNPLRLTAAGVEFGGAELPPTAVADFLPPILRKLTIAIPADPTRAESDAAVHLAAAVTARYGQQPTVVTVVPSAPPPPTSGPFERQILIRQGPDTGVSLQPRLDGLPDLRISGLDFEVTNQARLLFSDLNRLAVSSRAVAGPLRTSPQLPGDVTTLRRLGQPVVSAVALAPEVALGIDQTRMGRSAKGVRVHLVGSYTPPPSSVSARLVAIVGGETIDTWQVEDDGGRAGLIDRWIDVPDRLLQRYTTLGIAMNLAGNTGRCGEFQPLTLTIDGDSVVQSTAAAPPIPDGLQSLPQALMPRTLIGIGSDAFADTARATAIAVALQRLSDLPIDTSVTGVDEALAGTGPAVIIAADGWNHPGTQLPVWPAALVVEPEPRYAALQVFFDGHRSLLVATSNGAPAQLDALLAWVGADPRRFSKLDGAAVVGAAGREPVVVAVQSAPATGRGSGSTAWFAAGAAAAAALLGTALILLRGRRRPGGSDDG